MLSLSPTPAVTVKPVNELSPLVVDLPTRVQAGRRSVGQTFEEVLSRWSGRVRPEAPRLSHRFTLDDPSGCA